MNKTKTKLLKTKTSELLIDLEKHDHAVGCDRRLPPQRTESLPTEEQIINWFCHPHCNLGGATPLEVLKQGAYRRILKLVYEAQKLKAKTLYGNSLRKFLIKHGLYDEVIRQASIARASRRNSAMV